MNQEQVRKLMWDHPRAWAALAYRNGEAIDYNPYPLEDPRHEAFGRELSYFYAAEELTPRYGEP